MLTTLATRRPGRLDDRGIALPLALLALIAVTVIAATAAITSGSELALSNAHQGGVNSLYRIDRVVDEYVAGQANKFPANSSSSALVPGKYPVNDGKNHVTVARLSSVDTIPPLRTDSVVRRETYSITAEYTNSGTAERTAGRRVGKLILTRKAVRSASFNLNNGFVSGGQTTKITGSSIVSGVQDRALCDSMGLDTVAAVLHADGTTVEAGEKNVVGEIKKSDMDSKELANNTLNGDSIMVLARSADIQFGRLFDKPAFPTNGTAKSFDSNGGLPKTDPFNWGCPGPLDGTGTKSCANNGGDITYYPTVAIDAQGGTVSLQGNHGQGVLIIVNGNFKITGNFVYRGIILVDGAMEVMGTGGTSATKIQGGVIATGQVTLDPTKVSGNAMIQYNACEIANANIAMALSRLDDAAQEFESGTTAWFEVIR